MKAILICFCIFFGLISSLDVTQTTSPKPEIVDANHFFSETNKEKTYNVSDVEKDKPISLMIRKIEADPNYKNKVTVIMKSGEESTTCDFKGYDDLCVIHKLGATTLSMVMKCENLPCEVEWDIYQSE